MSQQPSPQNQSEEIDLGQLFKLIGNAFNKFFNFIGGIFKGIFHLLMLLLIFIQTHILKFIVAGVIGIAIGFWMDSTSDTQYESNMVVEPNFNSVQQLYNNLNFYNELAEAKDSTSLAQLLSISVPEAASIKEITVQSYSDENQKIKLFDQFIRGLDTTTQKVIDYASYLKNFNTFDARFHRINVISTNSRVAKKIQRPIISSIANNDYFKNQKRISDENLILQDTIYRKQLTQIDSLQDFYKKVLLETAKNPVGTNINLAENNGSQNKEIELIKQVDILKQNLVIVNQERADKSSIINVISDFPNQGVKVKGFFSKAKLWLPSALVLSTFIGLLLIQLNTFLKGYNSKK